MEPKDYYTMAISIIALVVSIFSNFFQKSKEDKRSIRKNLSDTLESVTKLNFENVKLRQNNANETPDIVEMRRNFNSQRRILVAHADYLVTNYDRIATEIDCNILAGAYNSIGDSQKAEHYWKKSIQKSESPPIRHMNLRGYAAFLFNQGKIEAGRNKYREALLIDLADNDKNRYLLTETYLMWARVERDSNNLSEETKLINDAISSCSRISNKNSRTLMEQQIGYSKPKKQESNI